MRAFFLSLLSISLLVNVSAQTRSNPDVIKTSKGDLTIQPIVHASLVISTPGLTIYADPTGGAASYSGINAPDLIIITDIHGDHFDAKTISAVRAASTTLIVPKAVADLMPDSLKSKAVIVNNGETIMQKGITISAIPMYNLPESATSMHTKGRGNGYVITVNTKKIYISGDTQGIPEMRSLKDIDMAFVCMNLPYTMNINEAADAVLAFKPRIVYPYHYRGQGGLSDVEGFKKLVVAGNANIDVRLLNWYPAKP